jgi:hypothetical protein
MDGMVKRVQDNIKSAVDKALEEKMSGMKKDAERKTAEAKDLVSLMNYQLAEIVNRLVAIETRLGAVERVVQETHPMILE